MQEDLRLPKATFTDRISFHAGGYDDTALIHPNNNNYYTVNSSN